MDLKIITMEESAFYELINKVVQHVKASNNITKDKWITGDEVMRRLGITSKTTLQKLRDEGKIRYSQPERKIILYDADSITQNFQNIITRLSTASDVKTSNYFHSFHDFGSVE